MTTRAITTRRRIWMLVAALSLGLTATGCGSGDTPETASTDSGASESDAAEDSVTTPAPEDGSGSEAGGDGCDLVSDELAAEILGIEIVRREPHTDPATGGVSCIKGTERVDDLSQGYFVSASVTPGGAAFFDQAVAEGDTEPVDGVGDDAAFLSVAGSLIIAAGTDLVTVQVVQEGTPGSLEDCVTVAEEVLSNL